MNLLFRNLLAATSVVLAFASPLCAQQDAAKHYRCTFGASTDPTSVETYKRQCGPPTFTPATSLTFPGPGTYTGQFLGKLTSSQPLTGETIQSVVLGGIRGITLSNLSLTTTPPGGAAPDGGQYLYGDIAVTNPAALAAGVLLTLYQGDTQVMNVLDIINLQGSGQTGCATDVTASVSIKTINAPAPVSNSDIWISVLRVTNITASTLTGPIELSLANLSENAGLFARAGIGVCPGNSGQPYRFVAKTLKPGESVDLLVSFTNSAIPSTKITYTPRVLAGGSQL